MKQGVLGFLRRGLTTCGLGPMVLAAVYLILKRQGTVQLLTVGEVCLGIFSLTVLAFVAGGMNVIYQVERLPLMVAILIHGAVLYLVYLGTYLINGWLKWGAIPILVFSGIFALGYLVIWVIICSVVRKRAARLNERLREQQSRVLKQ